MPNYVITINGDEVYAGRYGSAPDAVYGALLKQENDKYEKVSGAFSRWRAGRLSREEYEAAREAHTKWLRSPRMVVVKQVDYKVPRKARRIS